MFQIRERGMFSYRYILNVFYRCWRDDYHWWEKSHGHLVLLA